MHRFAPLLALLALACGNSARPDFVVHVVDHLGSADPIQQCESGSVRVDVQQGTNAVLTSNALVTGGVLGSLAVEIPSYGLVTQIQVTVTCTSGTAPPTQIGSTPHFIPVGYGFVDVVVGPPGQCRTLASPMLFPARVGPHLLSLHANVLVIGGVEDGGGPSHRVQPIDPVSLTYAPMEGNLDPLTTPVGLGGAALLDPSAVDSFQVVVASDTLTAIYDATPGVTMPVIPIDSLTGHLHGGGSSGEAAVVSLASNGVAIVGGSDGVDAVTGITWVLPDATRSITGSLHSARRRASGVLLNGHLLVVGGQGPGEPLFELIPLNEASADFAMAFGPTDELRYAPIVTSDAAHGVAWIALGTDALAGGAVRTNTWVVSGCASTCTWAPGPTIADPRSSVALVEHHVGAPSDASHDAYESLLVGGTDASGMTSTLIDRVTLAGDGTVSLTPFGDLTVPRASPGAADVGSGIVLVGGGGADERGTALSSIEICFPSALRPIGPE